ncbi:MAG: hypothetical protein KF764_13600 [Labilithrix sp.]|nr:hypothetical protein [Labilithrix sp.]MBX3221689.1 hypothetical protein [Labilithrix sp.]
MAATSDDDVPTRATATDHDGGPDGDTTAAATAPAARPPSASSSDDEEDRTVQQPVDPKVRTASRGLPESARVPAPPTPPRPAPPAQPMRMTSKRPTAVGLGSPLPITRPAAGHDVSSKPPPPVSSKPPPPLPSKKPPSLSEPAKVETEADADDGSITATAPRMGIKAAALPLTMPGAVQIREMPIEEDEPLDETEVRTLVTAPSGEPSLAPAPTPAAGKAVDVPPAHEADEPDDSVTTQTPSAVLHALLPEDEPRKAPPGRPPQPIPAAGRRPGEDAPYAVASAAAEDEDAYDAEESVTTRGPVLAGYDDDDSVTAQAPVTRPNALAPLAPAALAQPPTIDDRGGSSKKPQPKRQEHAPRAPAESDPDEVESITAQAPGHLTNMLRVIASPDDAIEDDEPPDNKTAVMLNAPVKPMHSTSGSLRAARPVMSGAGQSGSARAAAIADLREPSSDSGLRVARAEAPSGDHASQNAMMAAGPMMHGERGSGAQPAFGDLRTNRDVPPSAFANTEQAFHPPHGAHPQGMREFDFNGAGKKPRYGLLVGLVALLSFAIPLVLFLWLHQDSVDESPPRSASEVTPDLVGRADTPRVRAPKSVPPAASSAPRGGRAPWFPRRR